MKIPKLNNGETYVGAIINPDGTGHHIILLLPETGIEADWNTQMEWAKSIGGDLPDRIEQSMLFAHLKDRFKSTGYWSNTQYAAYADYAWYQLFDLGIQNVSTKDVSLRARAVRRVAI